jgi:hypothetical protein
MAARVGEFSGPTFEWTAPLNAVHPTDNIVSGSQFHEMLRARQQAENLTDEQMRDLEDQIRELEAVLRIDRDWRNST